MTLKIPPHVLDHLESLTKKVGAPDTVELVRRGLALYDLAEEHLSEEGQIIFRHKDGHEEVLDIRAVFARK